MIFAGNMYVHNLLKLAKKLSASPRWEAVLAHRIRLMVRNVILVVDAKRAHVSIHVLSIVIATAAPQCRVKLLRVCVILPWEVNALVL
jgi:hypothetical protein